MSAEKPLPENIETTAVNDEPPKKVLLGDLIMNNMRHFNESLKKLALKLNDINHEVETLKIRMNSFEEQENERTMRALMWMENNKKVSQE